MKYWPIAIVMALMLGIGTTNIIKARGQSESARAAQARLDSLPTTIAGWTSTPNEVPEKQLKEAEVQANISRTYKNEKNGSTVGVMILYGESGALGAHNPEVCFQGAGFRQVAGSARRNLPFEQSECWQGKFETSGANPVDLQVLWAWGTDGLWRASENARLDFANKPMIYKMYLSRMSTGSTQNGSTDPLEEFLPALLAELRKSLTEPSPSKPGA